MTDSLTYVLRARLGGLAGGTPLRTGAMELLKALGYESRRTVEAGSAEGFLDRFAHGDRLTEKQRKLFEPWNIVEIVLQFTAGEIHGQSDLLENSGFDEGRIESFLFLAVDVAKGSCTRTYLTQTTRAVNRLFAMPVILLFRYGSTLSTLTLAATHRRAHKYDDSRDVLDKVTLVKDIRLDDPHRAHVEILADLAFLRMIESGVRSFDGLHMRWEQTLDIEELNKRFYRELFIWFERAVESCRFPDDGIGDGSNERHVIRLITRLLFIWFLREKQLIPDKLFKDEFACSALQSHAPESADYYRAVLQNLFFTTLNTEIDKRAFSRRTGATDRDFTKYRYRNLLKNPDSFIKDLKRVPFVNGGLFDCLDEFTAADAGGKCIDAFTDDIETRGKDLRVPASLLLDEEDGLFSLFRRYKFTVEENTPFDREVALDPELLGRVFENLLAAYNPETRDTARKKTGSYYTPRLVVDCMVREALTETLSATTKPAEGNGECWRKRIDRLLDHSVKMDDTPDFFAEPEKRTLVAAIARLKVLDPAAGSGAFPMGVLQTLTLALRRLDPDNAYWEEIQKELARAHAGAAFDTRNRQRRNDALHEISDTFEKYRDSDYGRKLYLIQNSIYGVDIQPIACQIAKLRFFISLIIEQDPDSGAPNFGIKPLPNLETRFVAADTLIELHPVPQMELGPADKVSKLEKELTANRERHFHAGDRRTKLRLRDKDKNLRARLAGELECAGLSPRAARNIATWNPYDQNASAEWFNPEYMFGVPNGFDVVIGNPPYIQLQKDGGRLGSKYRDAGYETFAHTGDIYQLFYERGCKLLKRGTGTLAYITSNSWLKAEYGKRLRRWFARHHTPLFLIEMGKNVFDAIVDASVFLVREGGGKTVPVPAVDLGRLDTQDRHELYRHFVCSSADYRDGNVSTAVHSRHRRIVGEVRPDGEVPWSIFSATEWRVLEKMKAKGTQLKDWDVKINYGIKTGYNDAFIIDDATRDALIAEDPCSAEIIKPVLRGQDIKRWRARLAGKWLIDTHNGYADIPAIKIDKFPAVKLHLDRFYPQLEQRQDQGRTPYNLRNCAYHEDFEKEKLFWMDLTEYGRFSYDNGQLFCLNTGYVLSGASVKFLCSVFNSRLGSWFIRHTALNSGMGVPRWVKFTVERLPIPKLSDAQQQPFIRLVGNIIAAKDSDPNADVATEEEEINRLVYKLYGLTDIEIGEIEKAVS